METNTSEAVETSVTEDTVISTPEENTVDVVDTTQVDSELSTDSELESTETTEAGSDLLYYDIDGEEVSASTVIEWKNNGLRQADYTRKTQELAKNRKALEADQAKVAELNKALSDKVSELDQMLKSEASSIDWDELRDTDPSEYLKQRDLLTKKAKAVKAAKAEIEQKQAEEAKTMLEREQKLLLESQPTWQDPKQREADIALIDKYVTDLGFSETEIKQLTNHKVMIAVLDAARYKALQEKSKDTASAVQNAPKVIKASVKKDKPKATTRAERFYGSG